MKFYRILLIAVLISLGSSCTMFEDIVVGEVEDVKVTRLADRSVEFDVLIPIENTAPLRFRITNVDLDVYLHDEFVGNISSVNSVAIPAKSNELYTFPLRAEFTSILKSAFSIMGFFLDGQMEVVVKGEITVGTFPFRRRIPVNEKTIVDLN